jgi:maltose/maltodextrin transport system substrate-binding protein
LVWDYVTPQFTYPLLAAHGGYTFKRNEDGDYDLRDSGIDNAGARLGAQYLYRLIDQGLMPKGLDYTAAEAAFGTGEAAMTINGPWAWANLERRGINYGVAPLPSLNCKPARACVTVLAATINAASPNLDLATRFLERHLLTPDGLRTAAGNRPPAAVPLKEYQQELGQDPRRAATFASARAGDVIPPIPEMNTYWSALADAIAALTSGKVGPDQALEAAARQLSSPPPTRH